eukprot:s3243_g5.t1
MDVAAIKRHMTQQHQEWVAMFSTVVSHLTPFRRTIVFPCRYGSQSQVNKHTHWRTCIILQVSCYLGLKHHERSVDGRGRPGDVPAGETLLRFITNHNSQAGARRGSPGSQEGRPCSGQGLCQGQGQGRQGRQRQDETWIVEEWDQSDWGYSWNQFRHTSMEDLVTRVSQLMIKHEYAINSLKQDTTVYFFVKPGAQGLLPILFNTSEFWSLVQPDTLEKTEECGWNRSRQLAIWAGWKALIWNPQTETLEEQPRGKTWATDTLIAGTIELRKLINAETMFRFQSLKGLTKARAGRPVESGSLSALVNTGGVPPTSPPPYSVFLTQVPSTVPPPPDYFPEPSVGSRGHYQGRCAAACKYVRKARGCKDGVNCVRCHICQFSSKGATKKTPKMQFGGDATPSPMGKEEPYVVGREILSADGSFTVYDGRRGEAEIVRWLERMAKMRSYGWGKHHETFERGCNARGRLQVPRVPGHLELMAGGGDQTLNPRMTNVSHTIKHLSFSDAEDDTYSRKTPLLAARLLQQGWKHFPGEVTRNLAPLDGRKFVTSGFHQAYIHDLKVVSTVAGKETTYQFQHQARISRLSEAAIPQAQFHYDIEPFSIHVKTDEKRWYDFGTSLCAVLGGAFVVLRLASRFSVHLSASLKLGAKAQRGGAMSIGHFEPAESSEDRGLKRYKTGKPGVQGERSADQMRRESSRGQGPNIFDAPLVSELPASDGLPAPRSNKRVHSIAQMLEGDSFVAQGGAPKRRKEYSAWTEGEEQQPRIKDGNASLPVAAAGTAGTRFLS